MCIFVLLISCAYFLYYSNLYQWKALIDSKVSLPNGKYLPTALLANKADPSSMDNIHVNDQLTMNDFCKENGYIGWFETSAKYDINIEMAMMHLIETMLHTEAVYVVKTATQVYIIIFVLIITIILIPLLLSRETQV